MTDVRNERARVRGGVGLVALCVSLSLALPVRGQGPPYEHRQNVVYAEVHGTGLLMDVFVPTGESNGLAIIDVVSGAWHSDRGKILDHMRARIFELFCARGFTVFAIRPGSRTRYTLADMDQHVKTAIRFVKAHAADYRIDPSRLGLTGASAGGHLATLAALTATDAVAEAKDPLLAFDTRVQAVGVFFPPSDFLNWMGGRMADRSLLSSLLVQTGSDPLTDADIEARARDVSPRHRIAPTETSFLLIHGDADPLVPFEQSQRFVAALKEAGIRASLTVKPGGAHPWPTLPEEVATLADWFLGELARQTR